MKLSVPIRIITESDLLLQIDRFVHPNETKKWYIIVSKSKLNCDEEIEWSARLSLDWIRDCVAYHITLGYRDRLRKGSVMLSTLKEHSQRLLDNNFEAVDNAEAQPQENVTSSWCKSLTYQERILGGAICLLLGFLLSLGSTIRLARLAHGHPGPFAVAYTFGNCLSLSSSCFFVGPSKQLETMMRPKRRVSAMLYLFFIGLTLVLCFAHHIYHRILWVLLSVLCQFLALIWYCLSYVPYGRSIALGCCRRIFLGTTDDEV